MTIVNSSTISFFALLPFQNSSNNQFDWNYFSCLRTHTPSHRGFRWRVHFAHANTNNGNVIANGRVWRVYARLKWNNAEKQSSNGINKRERIRVPRATEKHRNEYRRCDNNNNKIKVKCEGRRWNACRKQRRRRYTMPKGTKRTTERKEMRKSEMENLKAERRAII